MVIISLEQCIKVLQEEVKQKIFEKQNEVCPNDRKNNLEERLFDLEFRKMLLTNLSEVEKKYLPLFLNKYSFYLKNNLSQEQTVSIEEKLALLLLRQKGIVYKMSDHKQNQTFIIPVEFVEAYFELTFQLEVQEKLSQPLSGKHYLYYLFEIIFLIKDKTIRRNGELGILKEKFSELINWEVLVKFLINEGLVIEEKQELVVLDQKCHEFFQKPSTGIKRQLTTFILLESFKDPFASHFILWTLFSGLKVTKQTAMVHYLKEKGHYLESVFVDIIKQLTLLDIISVTEDVIILPSEELEEVQGMEAGILEFLVPITVKNEALWIFRNWGQFKHWDIMIQISMTNKTIKRALIQGLDVNDLFTHLQKYLPEMVINKWEITLKQWLIEGKPIIKKEELVFYSLTERLHLKYIEEHWLHWWEKTTNGIVIEKKNMRYFEEVLNRLAVNVICKKEEKFSDQNIELVIINEFPELTMVLPEVEKLPKQWFVLTAYEERTIQRIVKQAILLQLWLQIETKKKELIKLFPEKLTNTNGRYDVISKDKVKFGFSEIVKLCVIHPLKI
ncbi:hypothetical protein H1D32_15890 [Anaerobacillus sp. CMMVII]|uniref:hypothetical protein n=1 Tax=Anaerobacillus sp. CMMVII TaxID=2755588 RepID=UPI0021B7B692|nr:hypothetical protein [Anaerobacillus sp. CMMVII]MCT8139049.1 hypothetical protein [Anaerobacillus sp. CMMVII]